MSPKALSPRGAGPSLHPMQSTRLHRSNKPLHPPAPPGTAPPAAAEPPAFKHSPLLASQWQTWLHCNEPLHPPAPPGTAPPAVPHSSSPAARAPPAHRRRADQCVSRQQAQPCGQLCGVRGGSSSSALVHALDGTRNMREAQPAAALGMSSAHGHEVCAEVRAPSTSGCALASVSQDGMRVPQRQQAPGNPQHQQQQRQQAPSDPGSAHPCPWLTSASPRLPCCVRGLQSRRP